MTEALWVSLVGLLAVPVSLVITWLVNRKKNISDIYKNITDQSVGAASIAVEAMQTTMEQLHIELLGANEKIDALVTENKKMQYELGQLRQQNMLLLQENHVLHRKIDDLTSLVSDTGEQPALLGDGVPQS